MPVQLTLRSPKGGRVLAERDYADGVRIDAASGWLVVVDRNGSVVAAHAACPGLEGRIVEYASAAGVRPAEVGEEPEGEVEYPDGSRSVGVVDAPPLRVADVREDGDRFADDLIEQLRRLGDTYGPLGVAIAAATLTDPQVLVRMIVDEHGGAEVLQGVRPPVDDDALRAEVARLTALLDDASREAERADRAEERLASMTGKRNRAREHAVRNDGERDEALATLATYRREVDEQTARAEREHADRLRLERLLAVAEERLAEERATVDLYRRRYGPVLDEVGGTRDEAEPHPIEEDPRRPHPNDWPDDAVLLRYVELRRLVSLHLERYADARTARSMLEGDVPLRLSEVLDR